MSEWTPGPWRIGDDAVGDPLTVWAATPGICITSVFDSRMGDDAPPLKQAKANARLIAAAPELYEALLRVVAIADRKTDEFDAAKAVLAKARGDFPGFSDAQVKAGLTVPATREE